ncbi:hypothetical protein MTO96_004399 [Rhipicephalus appendiculatus]
MASSLAVAHSIRAGGGIALDAPLLQPKQRRQRVRASSSWGAQRRTKTGVRRQPSDVKDTRRQTKQTTRRPRKQTT